MPARGVQCSRAHAALSSRPAMNLRVLLFASYADAFGAPAVDVALDAGATVGDLVTGLVRMPGGARLPKRPVIAVNQRYAAYEDALREGDEVAVIPPVAGG